MIRGLRNSFLISLWLVLALSLGIMVPCLGAGPEAFLTSSMNKIALVSKNGSFAGTIAVKEKTDISVYFDNYLDIRKYKVDPGDKRIASVTKTGIVKGKKAGTAVIRAYNSDGKEVANRRIAVEKPVLRLPYIDDLSTKCNAGAYFGTSTTLSANHYTSSKKKVAVIDQDTGDITFLKMGTTRITAFFGEGKNAAKVSCILKVKTGKPEYRDYYVDIGNGDRKKIKGYFDTAMSNKLYTLINDYRAQRSDGEDSKVKKFPSSYGDNTPSQNALNAIAETRALEAAVLFTHIRPNETSYYTAYNEEKLNDRNDRETVIKSALSGNYAGEDMVGGKNYDSASQLFLAIKTHDTSLMSNEYFNGCGVAVFVTKNKTRLGNGTKQQLKYYAVIDYIGSKKP